MSSHHTLTPPSSPADSVTLRLSGAVIMLLTAAVLLGTKQRETPGFTLGYVCSVFQNTAFS